MLKYSPYGNLKKPLGMLNWLKDCSIKSHIMQPQNQNKSLCCKKDENKMFHPVQSEVNLYVNVNICFLVQ